MFLKELLEYPRGDGKNPLDTELAHKRLKKKEKILRKEIIEICYLRDLFIDIENGMKES